MPNPVVVVVGLGALVLSLTDDIDLDIVSDVSGRTGRSMRNTKANPFYGRVKTVGALVAFFCAQDRQQPDTRLHPTAAMERRELSRNIRAAAAAEPQPSDRAEAGQLRKGYGNED